MSQKLISKMLSGKVVYSDSATQCLQHKLKPHITNLSYASQLNNVIERYSWLRQA